jgi:tripartite-type tricarboxylate transporter receptor subunit TctC
MMRLRPWLAAVLLALASPAAAEFPSAPIRILVPFPAGASTDIVVRRIGPKLSERLGQPVVIDNRGGASGMIATQAMLSAPPDGHTVLIVTTSHSALPALQKLPYDTLADFAPVALIADMPGVIVVNPAVPVHTIGEFLAYAKGHDMRYGSAGAGALQGRGTGPGRRDRRADRVQARRLRVVEPPFGRR